MRVAVDARWMQPGRRGGIGRGLANLLPHLASSVELHLLTDARLPATGSGMIEHPLTTPLDGPSALWLQWSAPRWLRRFDGIFHCPFYGLPFRQPVPMVVTLHDLTFEHHPEWFRPAARAAFRLQARHAARSARAVVTVSQHVRDDIVETYGVDPERILVAANAVDPVFRSGGVSPAADLGLTSPYVVALGGAPRRNSRLAVEAWRRATRGHMPLVVVGGQRDLQRPGVHVTGPLPDPQWAGLLADAAAFLYPTGYEGFGMPALEAAAAGTPVVCAPVGALPEVMGDAPSWAESLEPDALAAALSKVLDDPSYAEDRRGRGLARAAAAPGWDRCAAVHLEAYRRAG